MLSKLAIEALVLDASLSVILSLRKCVKVDKTGNAEDIIKVATKELQRSPQESCLPHRDSISCQYCWLVLVSTQVIVMVGNSVPSRAGWSNTNNF